MTQTYGNNNLGSAAMFNQRLLYKRVGYSAGPSEGIPYPFDLWYTKKLYGKLSPLGESIYPLENKLKMINGTNNIFVLNFVADAFEDFRRHYTATQQFDARGSVFDKLLPRKGYINPLLAWERYLNKIFKAFTESYLPSKKRYQSVTTFKDFTKQFNNFMRDVGTTMPMTLTNYIISNQVSPLSSGIMIEIGQDVDHGQDFSKTAFFTDHECFQCYAEGAQKYGFKIDKNAPWRLIADLKSPALKPYMDNYGLSFANLFEKCYEKAHTKEVGFIRDFFARNYMAWWRLYPSFSVYKYFSNCKRTLQREIERESIWDQKLQDEFPNSFWLGYYIRILSHENPQLKTEKQIFEMTAMAQTIEKEASFESATNFIFESFAENRLTR